MVLTFGVVRRCGQVISASEGAPGPAHDDRGGAARFGSSVNAVRESLDHCVGQGVFLMWPIDRDDRDVIALVVYHYWISVSHDRERTACVLL